VKWRLFLAVKNTGKPIAPDLLTRIFDPRVRTGEPEHNGESQVAGANLGIGLYVVREIATALAGYI
jgi:signal transduction histidine kinase